MPLPGSAKPSFVGSCATVASESTAGNAGRRDDPLHSRIVFSLLLSIRPRRMNHLSTSVWKRPQSLSSERPRARPGGALTKWLHESHCAGSVQSNAARGCVKTPNSPIAFPLRPQEPGEHTRIAPTSCFPQCHSWGWRPTGPSFHTVWRVDYMKALHLPLQW